MKYRILAFLGALLVVQSMSSCRREESIYVSPNSPETATPQTLLTVVQVQTFNTYEGDLTRNGAILIQHMVGANGQATQPQVYSLTESSFDNQWQQIYQTLLNGKTFLDQFGNGRPYYSGIMRVFMALNWGMLADMWGDVPYNEALQGKANYAAKYDAQQVVYQGIISMLDQAVTDLDADPASNLSLPTADFVFGGDPAAWRAVARSLKARYLLRYSNKGEFNGQGILDALGEGIASTGENFYAIHGTSGNEENQWYAYLNSRAYIVAGKTLVDSMLTRPTDVRLYYYYDSTGLGGVVGSPIDAPDEAVSYWGSYLAGGPDVPTPLMTYYETKFIEAEVKVRTGDATGAATALNEAIQASAQEVTRGEYDGADIATYDATNVTLERVMYEKWIAMFGQAEAYTDYRRTKLPVLTPNPSASISTIPERYPTPQSERVNNPNAPVPSVTTPTWFAQP